SRGRRPIAQERRGPASTMVLAGLLIAPPGSDQDSPHPEESPLDRQFLPRASFGGASGRRLPES
ncbi:MAG TPA: hypothetical protein VJU82_06970, partial [Acidobacteriaceae bacterium]|nr:hypothetical protein [Acidobacteriaceae bacterium]